MPKSSAFTQYDRITLQSSAANQNRIYFDDLVIVSSSSLFRFLSSLLLVCVSCYYCCVSLIMFSWAKMWSLLPMALDVLFLYPHLLFPPLLVWMPYFFFNSSSNFIIVLQYTTSIQNLKCFESGDGTVTLDILGIIFFFHFFLSHSYTYLNRWNPQIQLHSYFCHCQEKWKEPPCWFSFESRQTVSLLLRALFLLFYFDLF